MTDRRMIQIAAIVPNNQPTDDWYRVTLQGRCRPALKADLPILRSRLTLVVEVRNFRLHMQLGACVRPMWRADRGVCRGLHQTLRLLGSEGRNWIEYRRPPRDTVAGQQRYQQQHATDDSEGGRID
jgi:hypothetical protein